MRNKYFFVILLFLPLLSIAQNDDTEFWGSIKFRKNVMGKLQLNLERQLRWVENTGEQKKNFTELGFKYKAHKKHSLALNVRLINEINVLNVLYEKSCSFRSHFDLNSSWRFKKTSLNIKHRFRFQRSWDSDGRIDKTYTRSKFGFMVKRKNASPYIDNEFFWDISQGFLIDKHRFTVGLGLEIYDDLKLKLFLRRQREIQSKTPDKKTIVGLGTQYKF